MPADHPIYGPPPPCPRCEETQERLREALRERDSARTEASRKARLRQELAEALGVAHLDGDEQFVAAIGAVKAMRLDAGGHAARERDLRAAIKAAPHGSRCNAAPIILEFFPQDKDGSECTCWKSRALNPMEEN